MAQPWDRLRRHVDAAAAQGRRNLLRSLEVYDRQMTRRLRESDVNRILRRGIRDSDANLPPRAAAAMSRFLLGEEEHIARVVSDGREHGRRSAHLGIDVIANEMGERPPRLPVQPIPPINLSPFVHRNAASLSTLVHRDMTRGIKAGNGIRELTQDMLRRRGAGQERVLPEYIQRVVAAARAGGGPSLKAAVRDAMGVAHSMGATTPEHSLRSWTSEFLRRVSTSNGRDLDRQLRYLVHQRATYAVRRIARTEAARALTQDYMAEAESSGYIRAFRWNLSHRHPHDDICDVYAEADRYGMGPGVYPAGKVPHLPPHPHCLCYVSAWFDETGEDMVAEARVARGIDTEEDRAVLARLGPNPEKAEEFHEWMARQPQERRRRIMGVGVERIFTAREDLRHRIVSDDGIVSLSQAIQLERQPRRTAPKRMQARRIDTTVAAAREAAAARATGEPLSQQELRVRMGRDGFHHEADGPLFDRTDPEQIKVYLRPLRRHYAQGLPNPVDDSDDGENVTTAQTRGIRRRTRGIINSYLPGAMSRDIHMNLAKDRSVLGPYENDALRVFEQVGGTLASHSRYGNTSLSTRIWVGAERALDALTRGVVPDGEAILGLATTIHEELHGYSRNSPWAYDGIGVGLEEAMTEFSARMITQRLIRDVTGQGINLFAEDRWPPGYRGPYQHYVTRFVLRLSDASAEIGVPRTTEALMGFLDEGVTRWYSHGREYVAYTNSIPGAMADAFFPDRANDGGRRAHDAARRGLADFHFDFGRRRAKKRRRRSDG